MREDILSKIFWRKKHEHWCNGRRDKAPKSSYDNLNDQDVLNSLAGHTKWFGSGSRIIVVTTDKHLLRAHGINCTYEVFLPSNNIALGMFCQYALKQDSPPDGLTEFSSEIVELAGSLPLGLRVLDSSLWERKKEDCMNIFPRFQRGLDGKIEKTLRVGFDGLDSKEDKAIVCHFACLFNGEQVNEIRFLVADRDLDVDIGLKIIIDKSLIHRNGDIMKMHNLLEKFGKEIARSQSKRAWRERISC